MAKLEVYWKLFDFKKFGKKIRLNIFEKIFRIKFSPMLENNIMCWKLNKWNYVFFLWALISIK